MVLEEIYGAIKSKVPMSGNIGIIGLPGSGKSTFSFELQKYLSERNAAAIPWEGDIYSTSSRENRSAVMAPVISAKLQGIPYDKNWPERAYKYNIPLFSQHLQFFKRREEFSAFGLCHPKGKSLDMEVKVDFIDNPNKIRVKFDGTVSEYMGNEEYLLVDWALSTTEEIRRWLDFIIYVEADFDTRARRVKKRLLELPEPKTLDEQLFRDVEESQIVRYSVSQEFADIVLDNSDFLNRKLVRRN